MAFTATLLTKQQLPGGLVLETYSYVNDSGSTGGNITADATLQPEIQSIQQFGASTDGDSAALAVATDAGANIIKLTTAANDTGKAFMMGPAA
jgi:hypothetical protein